MKDIEILNKMPVILTKDPSWGEHVSAEEGAIIYLPEDAVLVMLPETKSVDLNE